MLPDMVVPSQKRPGIFRGGVLQIMVTRACDLSCFGCTAGSNLIHRPAVMDPDQFREAVRSLAGYFGVYGLFGGNPCTSRYFPDYCRILKEEGVPWEQRGIWTNRLMGYGPLCKVTFNASVSNCNVHCQDEAFQEFKRDWPEAIEKRKDHTTQGLTTDAVHSSPYVSMIDLGIPEADRLRMIGSCPINRHWSAMICLVRGELRAFMCEIQGHMAALHGDNPDWAGTGEPMPDVGLPVAPGWWRRPLADFEAQIETCCHHCAVPLNRAGQLAIGGEREEFSETHRFIARPKRRERPVEFVTLDGKIERGTRPTTEYLSGVTPGWRP